jgi:deoxyribodipyrimidine photo-lyase
MPTPPIRVTDANDAPIRGDGDYVLYWMTAHRRLAWNHALDHAIESARGLGKPLLIFEPLRVHYRWASDRLHRFVIEGMRDHAARLAGHAIGYYPYVEPLPGQGSPLLMTLAKRACLVIGDEYPCFFLPTMIATVKGRLPVRLRLVDASTVIPLRSADRTFTVAHSYRRWMQKRILDDLLDEPHHEPLRGAKLPRFEGVDPKVLKRWPAAELDRLLAPGGLESIPIDHQVTPCESLPGGDTEGSRRLKRFLEDGVGRYGDDRNHPDARATSGLSPYLHFGHISAHQILAGLLDREGWTPDQAAPPNGKNLGFWRTSEPAEAFIDQLLTWRELGFNMTHRHPDDYDRWESLPDWARKTLDKHRRDPRPALYTHEQFERAETHDEIWNAAQRELVTTGAMHNYLRMLWGKMILNWSESPEEALRIMIDLNNKYALDGRDPNSYSGIMWTLGRYDRPWGPLRPVFGSIRYMTSDSTRRKLKLKGYLAKFGPSQPLLPGLSEGTAIPQGSGLKGRGTKGKA